MFNHLNAEVEEDEVIPLERSTAVEGQLAAQYVTNCDYYSCDDSCHIRIILKLLIRT